MEENEFKFSGLITLDMIEIKKERKFFKSAPFTIERIKECLEFLDLEMVSLKEIFVEDDFFDRVEIVFSHKSFVVVLERLNYVLDQNRCIPFGVVVDCIQLPVQGYSLEGGGY